MRTAYEKKGELVTDNVSGLLVGAYERDNFGDILFLTRTRAYLGDGVGAATAPFPGDTTNVGGEVIAPYTQFLGEDQQFVWTVGGEVGGTSVEQAMSMSSAPIPDEVPSFASPYVIRPSRYAALRGARMIVNSAGVSGASKLVGRHKIETWAALREANFVSVRDRNSLSFLRQIGVAAEYAPDLVQTRALTHEYDFDKPDAIALVQLKEKFIRRIGVAELAASLLQTEALRRYHIRFFSAGEASGHDSTGLLQEVSEALNRQAGAARSDVSRASTAEEKVTEIAGASLWIGTSLHGYILSTAFAVPRVALLLAKIEEYAISWEIPYPTNVTLAELGSAIVQAESLANSARDAKKATDLAQLADLNMKRAVEIALEPLGSVRSGDATERALARVNRVTPLIDAAAARVRGALVKFDRRRTAG